MKRKALGIYPGFMKALTAFRRPRLVGESKRNTASGSPFRHAHLKIGSPCVGTGEGIYRCVLVTFGKKTPGGAGTHTGHTRETGAHGHTDLTDEPVDEPHNVNCRNTCKIPKADEAEEILLPSSRFSWLRWTARGPPSSLVSRSTRTWLLLSRRISTSLASAA